MSRSDADADADAESARPAAMHLGQLDVRVETVRALVRAQFPRWANLDVTPVRSAATVNAVFRIGDGLAARFPLQGRDVAAVRHGLRAEAASNRELVGRTRFGVPEPVALGEPGSGYPLPWAVQTWLPGATAFDDDPASSDAFASDLAQFITDVRAIDTRGRTFDRPGRGGDLPAHTEWVQTCLRRSEGHLDVPALRRSWEGLVDLPRTAPDAMTHGDLTCGNVLVSGGRLAGVLDCGGLGPADPALDLVGAWHLLDAGPRRLLREELQCDDLEWQRGKAWAFEQAVGLVWYYARTNRTMSRMGRRTLARLLADDPSPYPPPRGGPLMPIPVPTLDGLPALRWHGEPVTGGGGGDRLTITAPAGTDWFVDPRCGEHTDSAPALLCDVPGDFALSARVTPGFTGTFDAGVLCLRAGANRWAKLCFERSPDAEAMVVSVVTRGSSDDANSVLVDGASVHLRVCRTGRAYAFHHSRDGRTWHFVRFFTLDDDEAPAAVGFLAQAPAQQPCAVTFQEITLTSTVPADLRDGS